MTKNRLLYINKLALKYFCKSLNTAKKPKQYLLNRIGKKTIQKFFVGYNPQDYGLIERFEKHNITEREALHLGLVNLDKDGNVYETFSKRIVFPIIQGNKVLGFAGRSLAKNPSAKYLNSKATLLYDKSQILYLLDAAKKSIYKKGYTILVEGYFDVLSLYDNGIKNSVACCGTALKKSHAELLKRWTDLVYIAFDGDAAGQKAAKKACKILKNESLDYKNITIPNNLDPDDYVHKYGTAGFLQLLKNV